MEQDATSRQAQTRRELAASLRLRGLEHDVRETILNDVMLLLERRFASLTADEQQRIGQQAIKWLVWRQNRAAARPQRASQPLDESVTEARGSEDAETEQTRLELRQAIHDAMLRSLSEEEQVVVLRRFIQNTPVEEIASELGVPEQRVYYLSRRALEVLRDELRGFEDLYP
jgi:RNA polymerase sigma factor (sigma-70 family)